MSKKVYSSSVDRELKSLQRNSIQQRRLSEENKKVDLHLRRETKMTDRQKEVLVNDRKVIESKSPTLSEWKKQHEAMFESWKERERAKIDKRYRSPARHFNPNVQTSGKRAVDEDDL